MGLNESEKEEIDADEFFATIDETPEYLTNIGKPLHKEKLKKCSLSFADVHNSITINFRNQQFAFPIFEAQQLFGEFDQIDCDGKGKVMFKKYLQIAMNKYPHVPQRVIINIYNYVSRDRSKSTQECSVLVEQFQDTYLSKSEYTQQMYILHHFSLVKYNPMISLFLYLDTNFIYNVSIQQLLLLFYQHFDADENDIMYALKLSSQWKNKYMDLKEYLLRLPEVERHHLFEEENIFLGQLPQLASDGEDNEHELDINTLVEKSSFPAGWNGVR